MRSDSVTGMVNREVLVVAGWGRAILLQLAHPAVAAGVRDHSAFRGSLIAGMRRLRSTVRAMLSVTFGDTEEMRATAARIHRAHDRVPGAHNPTLQRWVHATVVESTLITYELLVGPLARQERDRYCAEAAVMERLLGLPEAWLPRDSAQLEGYMREMLTGGSLVVTADSRALAREVLYPPTWRLAWPAFRAVHLLTIGSLPAAIRQAYGFDWQARDERSFARWMTAIRTTRRMLPPIAREWPMARRHHWRRSA
jgi:uncharacterized protein (DUF2236 family)